MNFFRKLFGGQPTQSVRSPDSSKSEGAAPPPPLVAPEGTPESEIIRAHDAYGREVRITKTQWRESILPDLIARHWDQPEPLAGLIVQSLRDGFAADVLAAAEHLAAIDIEPARGGVLHAVVLLELKRVDEAEAVLRAHLERYGETAAATFNLAKVYAARGEEGKTLETLWRALELDPNHEAAFGWLANHHLQRGGEAAARVFFGQVAALPDAWRARLWLARDRLINRDLPSAIKLYDEALERAPRPVPADLLQQMSGDLGNHAHLPELLQLTAPYFDIDAHGIGVANNLIKAYADLGQLDTARRLLDRLYAKNRPDWKSQLVLWDQALAQAAQGLVDPIPPRTQVEVTLLALEGPVWLPPDSPAVELYPTKADETLMVAFLGGTAALPLAAEAASGPRSEGVRLTPTDAPGRLSRALPLYLSEQVEAVTPALARTLVAWVVKPTPGFVLGGVPWDDATCARHARNAPPEDPADYVVVSHLDCRAEPWTVELRLIRTIDGARLGTVALPISAADPGAALPALREALLDLLAAHAEIARDAAAAFVGDLAPPVEGLSHYLLRLEQLLVLRTAGIDPAKCTLVGEREALDGMLRLCLEHPANVPCRLLFVHALRVMRRVRPKIVAEFRERAELLMRDKPLAEPAQGVAARILADAFS